jgi:lipopolysaccharide transport system ATP-binding protein
VTGPTIHLRGVGRIYDAGSSGGTAVTALRDVTLSVRNGERIGIVGDNGAGKSTLLQIIAGVNTQTSGSVEIEGHVHAILTIGLGLREEATGRENLFLEGALLGKTRDEIEAKLAAMIDFAELGDFIDQPVRSYSSGMKSRLSFASLAHIDPEILIIDEALSVGDAFFAVKAMRMMQELCARGRIVILVSHSIGAIKQMCERCVWLDGGLVKADGPAEQVASAYAAATRVRQEAEIAVKFGAGAKSWSVDPGVALSAAKLVRAADRVETAMIEAGTIAALEVSLETKRPLAEPRLRLWIESNDGLLLADEQVSFGEALVEAGDYRLSVGLGCVDWRPFLYQAHIELVEHGTSIAHVVASFKVYSDVTIFGGNPLLRTPPAVKAADRRD